MSGHESANPMVTDVFVKGAVQGWNIAVTSTIPNVLMAFVIIKVLNHSGLLTIFGELFAPIMAIFGLPGEAAAVLLRGVNVFPTQVETALLSMGGGVGVAVSLFDQGLLTGEHVAIVAPSIYLMGSQVQYMGRCLGVIGIKGSNLFKIMALPIVTAFVSLFVMKLIVLAS